MAHLTTFQLEAYNGALKWARTRYGRKLAISSIESLLSMIMPLATAEPSSVCTSAIQEGDFPHLPHLAQEMPSTLKPAVTEQPPSSPVNSKSDLSSYTIQSPLTTKATIEIRPPSPQPQRTPQTSRGVNEQQQENQPFSFTRTNTSLVENSVNSHTVPDLTQPKALI